MGEEKEQNQIPEDIADYIVECPVEGQNHGQHRLGDLADREDMRQYAEKAVTAVAEMEENGIPREQAIKIGMGFFAVKDTEGNFLQLTADESAKKKLKS